jgi:hypothetical protein
MPTTWITEDYLCTDGETDYAHPVSEWVCSTCGATWFACDRCGGSPHRCDEQA